MRRKPKIGQMFIGLVGLSLLLFTRCAPFAANGDKSQVSPMNSSVVTANTTFGFNVFNEIRKTEQDKNIFISPFSISVALAMTMDGTAGETEQAMKHALRLQGLNSEAINTGYAQLRQALQAPDPEVTLTIANSLWADQSVRFMPDFLQRNTQFFGAEISTLDLESPSAPKTINRWVNTRTNGKIPKIVGEIDPKTVLFLINAIYLNGRWQRQFDPSETMESPFYIASDIEKQVPMMMDSSGWYPYYQGDNFQAINLAYGDGRMSMYIFLPDRASDLNTFSQNLNAENWENWMSQFRKQRVSLGIPKFKFEYEKTLNNALKSLGMGIAFGRGANFSRMAVFEGAPYIHEVRHKTFVAVDEEGTEAAAATVVTTFAVSAVTEPPLRFIADRPFFFAIRDNKTKTVLFMGTVVDP